jgi:hypothetical protein
MDRWSLPNYYVYHYLGIIELLFTLIIACKLICDDEYTQIVELWDSGIMPQECVWGGDRFPSRQASKKVIWPQSIHL